MSITYAQKQAAAQKKDASSAASIHDKSSQSKSLQRKADIANNAAQRAEAPRPNNTGMPDNLKSGIESLSGFSMDDVRVHYNSSKPATVQALAYTQGTDIHVAPGQEKHLPHEAWHVAQQMAGRVSPTTIINGMPVNDNTALEHEADVMGEKAVQCKGIGKDNSVKKSNYTVLQCLTKSQKDKIKKYTVDDKFKSDHIRIHATTKDVESMNARLTGPVHQNSVIVEYRDAKNSKEAKEMIERDAFDCIKYDNGGDLAKAVYYDGEPQIACKISNSGINIFEIDGVINPDQERKITSRTREINSFVIKGNWNPETNAIGHHFASEPFEELVNMDYIYEDYEVDKKYAQNYIKKLFYTNSVTSINIADAAKYMGAAKHYKNQVAFRNAIADLTIRTAYSEPFLREAPVGSGNYRKI